MKRRSILFKILIGALCIINIWGAYADNPLGPPQIVEVCSHNMKFCALSNPETKTIVVYSSSNKSKILWQVSDWFRWAKLSNDGKNLVKEFGSLIPENYNEYATSILVFYMNGKKVNTVTLQQIITDRKALSRTASNYMWGVHKGFNSKNEYVVETGDKRTLYFNPNNGKKLRIESDKGTIQFVQ